MRQKLLPKLMVMGYGGHGKDTVCEILEKLNGFTFKSSSKFCSEKFIYNIIKSTYNYNSEDQCYKDRRNHRDLWYNLINDYCTTDLTRLGRNLFSQYDIYCGARNVKELEALKEKGMFECSVWVDRSEHLEPEKSSSITITPDLCDFIIDNNGSLEDLEVEVEKFLSKFLDKIGSSNNTYPVSLINKNQLNGGY